MSGITKEIRIAARSLGGASTHDTLFPSSVPEQDDERVWNVIEISRWILSRLLNMLDIVLRWSTDVTQLHMDNAAEITQVGRSCKNCIAAPLHSSLSPRTPTRQVILDYCASQTEREHCKLSNPRAVRQPKLLYRTNKEAEDIFVGDNRTENSKLSYHYWPTSQLFTSWSRCISWYTGPKPNANKGQSQQPAIH